MNHPAWIIIAGSSVAGLEFIGPFRDYNAAEAYYKSQGSPTPWMVTALDPPESEEPSAEPVTTNEALRNALDAYVRADIYDTDYAPGCGIDHAVRVQAIAALDRAYAESKVPSPEPMAWRIRTGGTLDYVTKYRPDGNVSLSNITPLYAHPEEPSAECNDLHEQYNNLKEHYDVLSRTNDELDDTRQSLLESEKRRWDEIHALRAENHTLAAERSKTLSDSEGMISARDRRVNELNQECDRLDTENNELSARVWALQKENDRLVRLLRDDTETRDLKAERDNLRNLYENVVEHRDSLFDALGDQTDKNYQLRTERDALNAEADRLSAHATELHTQRNAAEFGLGNYKAEAEALSARNKELSAIEANLNAEIQELIEDRDSWAAQSDDFEAKYEDLKARCTQPYFKGLVDERDAVRAENRKLRDQKEGLNDYVTWLQGRVRSLATRRES